MGHESLQQLQEEVSKVLIGKDKLVQKLLTAMITGGHVLLEDVPGTGKTKLARTVAAVMDCSFQRVQFTPDVLPSDVTGIEIYNQQQNGFETRPGPVMTQILLVDEINRATPKTQASLLEAMEEKQVTIGRETMALPSPFFVIATQNPVESGQGTFPLPEAQLDRFLMMLNVDYPTPEEEEEMINLYSENDRPEAQLNICLTPAQLRELKQEARRVHIAPEVKSYMLQVIRATRASKHTAVGVSPRGTLLFHQTLQTYAFLHGRNYVEPDDIRALAGDVLAHRLVLTMEAALQYRKEDVLELVFQEIEVPTETKGTI
ncbi:MoxR-like ATPase [Salsuginibacillus halophilus]|uniref:MoxR-like ATPase n=1 Tax=Salsuginibacillus halophilus TaxID=517424 RepID=A0A2P8HG87_9BACI|nr:MoxR family ATPase [Salsuginibacillus halophilus]PSL45206.1 MoxR-like ATPase [Salsuginibacillus halophilus]